MPGLASGRTTHINYLFISFNICSEKTHTIDTGHGPKSMNYIPSKAKTTEDSKMK